MTTLKPQKAQIKSALISTDQPHNYCNIDEAPQNSSNQPIG